MDPTRWQTLSSSDSCECLVLLAEPCVSKGCLVLRISTSCDLARALEKSMTSSLFLSAPITSSPAVPNGKLCLCGRVFNPRLRLRIYHCRLIEWGRFQPAEVINKVRMDPSAWWELLKLWFLFKTLVCSQHVALRNSREER